MTKHGFTRLMTISVCVAVLAALMTLTPTSAKAPITDNASEKISFKA